MTIYAYHRFCHRDPVPTDVFRRSVERFRDDLKRFEPGDEIHFDDASRTAYELGLPAAEAAGRRVSLFVPTGLIGHEGHMTWAEVTDAARRGHLIESHGHNHVDMSRMDADEVAQALDLSIACIEGATGRAPERFVPPFDRSSVTLAAVAAARGLRLVGDRFTVRAGTTFARSSAPLAAPATAEYWNQIYAGTAVGQPGGSEGARFVPVLERIQALADEAHEGALDPFRMLEVGAGYGRLSIETQRRWPAIAVTALDHAQEAKARSPHNPYVMASCYEMPFPWREFSLVVASQTLEYLDEPERFLNEASRVGHALLVTATDGKHATCEQVRVYSLDSLRALLLRHGWDVNVWRWEGGPMLIGEVRF